MYGKQVQGQSLNKPILVENIQTEGSLQALEDLYPLREVEFERIQNGANKFRLWSIQLSFAYLGYILSIGPQLYDDYEKITDGEWAVLVVGLIACAVLLIIGACAKDKKKDVMNKIESFFSDEVQQK